MASEFITRVEHGKDEPYTVIFRTDDADKYKHIEDECRRMIGHEKPTVDAVKVVRCKDCRWACLAPQRQTATCMKKRLPSTHEYDHFCADGERRSDGETDHV